ncbi:MAG: hypothetical protein OEW11_04510 [Nitrospirota bacterium]|nr:hypothetical protein [Nitrospirota bacterium]
MKFKATKAFVAVTAVAAVLSATPALALDTAFTATMNILTALAVTKNTNLTFGNYEAGVVANLVVAPADPGAATFDITAGAATTPVVIEVVEKVGFMMITGAGLGATQQIPVDFWTFGGVGVTDNGNETASATLGALGTLAGIQVGATAALDGTDIVGAYSGTATFRVTYL